VGTVLKVALGVIVAFLVLIVGCAVLITAGSEGSEISQEDYESIQNGMSRAEVEDQLGEEPVNVQDMEIEAPNLTGGTETLSHDCIYFNKEGDVVGIYQFCFENDRLTSKASY
jgi:hypothetical protein